MWGRVLVLIAIAAAVALSISAWRGVVPSAAEPSQTEGGLRPAVSASPSDARQVSGRRHFEAATSPSAAATPRLWASRRQEFERSADLFAFAQRLQPAADAGDAEARWLVSRVHEYCDGYARAPVDYGRDTALIDSLGLPAARPLGQARNRVAARCRRFVPGDTVSFVQLVRQRRDAADAGSLAAEASLLAMGEPIEPAPEYRRDLIERVQASRDPDAFVALAPAMGVAAVDDAALAGRIAGSRTSEFAWQLAACHLGLDCSADGVLMTSYCAHGGICAQDAAQDFSGFVREAALSPDDADAVDHMVNALVGGQRLGMVMR